MRTPDSTASTYEQSPGDYIHTFTPKQNKKLSRQTIDEEEQRKHPEEESMIQMKPVNTAELLQRQTINSIEEDERKKQVEDEETIHAKEQSGEIPVVSSRVKSQIDTMCTGGETLPDDVRATYEKRFGNYFGDVRVHRDSQASESARTLNARAYTVGRNIVFGAGEYAPETTKGNKLLAHELVHVVQQNSGLKTSATVPAIGNKGQVWTAEETGRSSVINTATRNTIQRQPATEAPEFPDFRGLSERITRDVGVNLFDYGHHLYRIATLYPDRSDLLEEALGRYALGTNLIETAYLFAGIDQETVEGLALGTGILLKGLTFAREGELELDFQFDIGRGLKIETNLDLAVNPDDFTEVTNWGVGIGLVGRF